MARVKPLLLRPTPALKGEIRLLGDKSIAHRAIILSALAEGVTRIRNFPANKDCFYTLTAFKKLGLKIKFSADILEVFGKGLKGLKQPNSHIFVGESGTTLRMLLGVLAGQEFSVCLTAGESLLKRPMRRVTEPLRKMGAVIKSQVCRSANRCKGGILPSYQVHLVGTSLSLGKLVQRRDPAFVSGSLGRNKSGVEEYPPITIQGGNLKGITYRMPVASAQVKSALLLAGLYARGITRVIEPIKTRDHTERLLKLFKARIKVSGKQITIRKSPELVSPKELYIPGDISAASFFLVLAAILPKARLRIKGVSLNPTRTGIIRVLKRMGAKIKVTSYKSGVRSLEPMGDILVRNSRLKGIRVRKQEVPSLIDELPILLVAACLAKGKSVFEGIGELRVKETDRIRAMSENLRQMGACIQVTKDKDSENIMVEGPVKLKGAMVSSFGDHRTAMSMIVAGLAASGQTKIDDIRCIDKSFPGFWEVLKPLLKY